ncbi:hypothetical protein BDN70DRAFT_889158 [Pholiota conissans]|uniref:Uncharacterized protein n=1 Tax=Pholiota conissans TaxID=109636 RepID=A0A9P6CQK9_9AGAR|nr:hypothetical protein BDN70DRAFT_889158 [Pholiota conissans]
MTRLATRREGGYGPAEVTMRMAEVAARGGRSRRDGADKLLPCTTLLSLSLYCIFYHVLSL